MKYDFTFHNPTRIHFGKDAMQKLPEELAAYGNNVMLLYGKGAIKRIGLYDEVVNILNADTSELTRTFQLGAVKYVSVALVKLFHVFRSRGTYRL